MTNAEDIFTRVERRIRLSARGTVRLNRAEYRTINKWAGQTAIFGSARTNQDCARVQAAVNNARHNLVTEIARKLMGVDTWIEISR